MKNKSKLVRIKSILFRREIDEMNSSIILSRTVVELAALNRCIKISISHTDSYA